MNSNEFVTASNTGSATVARVHGEVDFSRSPDLRVSLMQMLQHKPATLVVDLSDVPYMDSSGVATLVEAMGAQSRRGAKLVLCGLAPKVRSIFEIARLDSVFKITGSLEEALSA